MKNLGIVHLGGDSEDMGYVTITRNGNHATLYFSDNTDYADDYVRITGSGVWPCTPEELIGIIVKRARDYLVENNVLEWAESNGGSLELFYT